MSLVSLGVGGGLLWRDWQAQVADEAMALEAVAAEAAAGVDSTLHHRIQGPQDASGPEFGAIQRHLRHVKGQRGIDSPIYTLRRADDGTRFVVMTNEEPFIGDRYGLRPEMEAVFAQGGRGQTGLYSDDHGAWISGYAAVVGPDGTVDALVCVDRPSADLVALRRRGGLMVALVALLLGAAAAVPWPSMLTSTGFGRPVAGLRRSLAVRIGVAGALAVLLAATVTGLLEHSAARAELLSHLAGELRTVVAVAAPGIDVALHEAVVRNPDPESPAFVKLQRRLRQVQEGAQLHSPVYTLRRDGGLARFVVMTNEEPFIGDPNELRPGVAQTFEDAEARTEGPYVDAHGTWISAWAPIRSDDGSVVAVLQADHEIGALIVALENRLIGRSLFGLLGVLVAFLAAWAMARGIALPVRRVADAARQVGEGQLDVHLPEDREDEVGDLARAVNRMSRGLKEREQLKDMFGKYMAVQVVQELMGRGELRLEGELRELSVLITDIRGYTALTEQLGAAEVVALLNEYFAILVEVVIEHDGVIDKFMGDAMLCWFGAPMPVEDHAARAVSAAVAMQERTADWNRQRVADGLAPVATGIGIAAGKVVVGNIGSPKRLEYTAIGDAVNLASRLCSKAGAGEVLVSDNVRAGATGQAGFIELGLIDVKGLAEPVAVHTLNCQVVSQP